MDAITKTTKVGVEATRRRSTSPGIEIVSIRRDTLRPDAMRREATSLAVRTLLNIARYRIASRVPANRAKLGAQRTPCLPVCLYRVSYVRHSWSRGSPRATRKRKPAHLKFKGHMRWRYGCVVASVPGLPLTCAF